MGTSTVSTTGLPLTVGQTKTVAVELFSNGPLTDKWNVQAVDTSTVNGGSRYLSFVWKEAGGQTATGQNGDILHLEIKMTSPPPLIADGFLLLSGAGSGDGGVVGSSSMGLVYEPIE